MIAEETYLSDLLRMRQESQDDVVPGAVGDHQRVHRRALQLL